jgi:hypothetical protein
MLGVTRRGGHEYPRDVVKSAEGTDSIMDNTMKQKISTDQ